MHQIEKLFKALSDFVRECFSLLSAFDNVESTHLEICSHKKGLQMAAYLIGQINIKDLELWQEYVDGDYTEFATFPTYNYTTPHNIQKWTARTNKSGEGSCAKNCHFKIDGNDTINKSLYLLEENLLDWELEATSKITMDDELLNK